MNTAKINWVGATNQFKPKLKERLIWKHRHWHWGEVSDAQRQLNCERAGNTSSERQCEVLSIYDLINDYGGMLHITTDLATNTVTAIMYDYDDLSM